MIEEATASTTSTMRSG